MAKRTYEVSVNANALRLITVRAASGREALDIASARIKNTAGPWTIDFPGAEDEHFIVSLGEAIIGPDAVGGFADEDDDDEDEAGD